MERHWPNKLPDAVCAVPAQLLVPLLAVCYPCEVIVFKEIAISAYLSSPGSRRTRACHFPSPSTSPCLSVCRTKRLSATSLLSSELNISRISKTTRLRRYHPSTTSAIKHTTLFLTTDVFPPCSPATLSPFHVISVRTLTTSTYDQQLPPEPSQDSHIDIHRSNNQQIIT